MPNIFCELLTLFPNPHSPFRISKMPVYVSFFYCLFICFTFAPLKHLNHALKKIVMKLFPLLFSLSLLALKSNAQQVTGTAKDTDGKGLNGVTISLIKDSTVVKLAATNETGIYQFSNVLNGIYHIQATYVGHSAITSKAFTVSGADVSVDDILLTKASGELKGVTVTASRPLVEMKADKMIVNVEGTINATGSDALELLRKSPGVQVDKDDNLSVSGKNGVQVYIDNRPTPLAGQDLANYLKILQSSQIEAIEIITNPSAKYEAAGNAGIINIRLKKNKSFGTNGSVNAMICIQNKAFPSCACVIIIQVCCQIIALHFRAVVGNQYTGSAITRYVNNRCTAVVQHAGRCKVASDNSANGRLFIQCIINTSFKVVCCIVEYSLACLVE